MNRPVRASRLSRLLAAGITGTCIALVTMGLCMILSARRLHQMSDRIFTDASGQETAALLEKAVLSSMREGLLWHVTRDATHLQRWERWLGESDRLVRALPASTTSPEESRIVDEVRRGYGEFRAQTDSSLTYEQARRHAEHLQEALAAYRDCTHAQMAATTRASRRLDRLVDLVTWVVFLMAAIITIAGGVTLWMRILRPVLFLTQAAAAYGRADLRQRVPVAYDDEIGHLCATFNDMAAALLEREQERLDFVAAVAHDLRSPLSAISLATQAINRRGAPEAIVPLVTGIARQAARLDATISDLTDTVQVHTGRLRLELEALDLCAVARGVLEQHQHGAAGRRVIHLECPPSCPLMGDRRRLERVLWNLLSNAIKYSGDDTQVLVEVEDAGEVVMVRVSDQGAGLAPEELARLFQPFARAESTKHMSRGTGLGLYSIRQIVEAHGGTVVIRSALGVGTTVEIRIRRRPLP